MIIHMDIPARITPEEEREIYSDLNKQSKKRLIEGNILLAVHTVNKFNLPGEKEEFLSVAFLGLTKAASTFDPKRQIKFSTYASVCMKKEILFFLRNQKKKSRDISFETEFRSRQKTNNICVLKDMVSDSAADEMLESVEDKERLRALKTCLNKGELNLLEMWESGMLQSDIAEVFDTTQSNISRKLKKIFKKMRDSEIVKA